MKNKNKKNRIAFKRTHDFWAGAAFSSLLIVFSLLFILDSSIEIKSGMTAFLIVDLMFLYYLNLSSKIVKASLKTLMFWKNKKDSIVEYSVAIDHKTLIDMVESKKNLEEALKAVKGLETDQKISDFIKLINNNNKNGNNVWKN